MTSLATGGVTVSFIIKNAQPYSCFRKKKIHLHVKSEKSQFFIFKKIKNLYFRTLAF